MPRQWHVDELEPERDNQAETARLSRYAARLLAAAVTATAMSAFVAHSSSVAIFDPAHAAPDPVRTPGAPSPRPEQSRATTSPSPTAHAPVAGAGVPASPLASPLKPLASPEPDRSAAESITLTDDDQELPLFQEDALAPDRLVSRCITITYAGTEPQAAIDMRVEASGELADWLTLQVSVGTPAGRDCEGFTATQDIASGSLRDLAQRTSEGPLALGSVSSEVPFGLRIVSRLRGDTPDDRSGASAQGAFIWSAR